jgi:elongator complex protein 3
MSFETRPDFINQKEIEEMLLLGATKIEIGVQSIYNDVLILNKRGHLVEDTIKATEMLKNAGFKVSYQVMLNLPGSSPKRDIEMFKELFSNPDFKPDYLKIYPCALVKEAPLYNLYLKGEYKPYTKEVLIETIKEIKKHIPIYVRIERIIRDIPSPLIVEGGAKLSNLRQLIDSQKICKCIRCREIKDIKNEEVLLFREDYVASNGKEIFLSFEDKNRKNVYSILRLRITNSDTALIREVHVYGQATPISKKGAQHKGLGILMVKEAEKIANKKRIAIISGVGVRDYYRKKLGYRLSKTYMIKTF